MKKDPESHILVPMEKALTPEQCTKMRQFFGLLDMAQDKNQDVNVADMIFWWRENISGQPKKRAYYGRKDRDGGRTKNMGCSVCGSKSVPVYRSKPKGQPAEWMCEECLKVHAPHMLPDQELKTIVNDLVEIGKELHK